jgi:Tetratricopeptide repeat
MAILCQSQERLEEADHFYKRCLLILRKVLSPTHPMIAACLMNYARLEIKSTVAAERLLTEHSVGRTDEGGEMMRFSPFTSRL